MLIVGGAFSVINRSGAIDSALIKVISFSKNNPEKKKIIIPIVITMFSFGGATIGLSEEVLVFLMITIPLAYALNYDVFVGVAITFVAAAVGFASAFLNPFTVGIAQGIADVRQFSGWEYRIVVWVIMTTILIIYTMRYASKIDKDKSKRIIKELNFSESEMKIEHKEFTVSRKTVLFMLLMSFVVIIYGINAFGWYINEIAGVFFALGILTVIVSRMRLNDAVESFTNGAKDMMTAALIIGFAKGLLIIAQDGKIIDTMLFYVSTHAKDIHPSFSVQVMLLFQSFMNFFIPSGSGQAALTMPVMTPLSDILGISRQTAVLAFQFGDGLTNLIIPTSGVTMGVLSIAKIPFDKWLKWIMPIFLIMYVVAMLLLIPPILFFDWA